MWHIFVAGSILCLLIGCLCAIIYCSCFGKKRGNAILHAEPSIDPFKDYSGLNNTSTTMRTGGTAAFDDRVSVLNHTNFLGSNMQNATLSQRSAESQDGKKDWNRNEDVSFAKKSPGQGPFDRPNLDGTISKKDFDKSLIKSQKSIVQ